MTDVLNAETIKQIVVSSSQAAAKEAVRTFVQDYPHLGAPPPSPPKAEIPAPIKWAGIIIAALMTFSVAGMAAWVVTTLSELQLTVREISTRQQTDTTQKDIDDLKSRVGVLEQGKAGR